LNIRFQSLFQRARDIYANQGLTKVIILLFSFGIRYSKEKIGRLWLYNIDAYLNFLYWLNTGRGQYQTLADPFDLVKIDPDTIEYVTGRNPYPGKFMWQDIGLIADGNWDQTTERFDDLPTVYAIRQYFEKNNQWDRVRVKNIPSSNQSAWCSKVDKLYKSIQGNGYKYQYEILSNCSSPRPFGTEKNCSGIERFYPCDEVAVDIGRDGKFLFVDGRHRLTIAKILDLDEIPVRISARHEEWQRIREQVANADVEEKLPESVKRHRNHPDLRNIYPSETNKK